MVDEVRPEKKVTLLDIAKASRATPGHGGWVPKKHTPLIAAIFVGVTSSIVPPLMMENPKWNVILASALMGASTALATFFGMRSAGPRNLVLAFFVLAGVGLSSCAGADPVLISGQSLATAKAEYHATVQLMDQALASGLINKEQYHHWREFSDYFEMAFDHALALWDLATRAIDQPNQGRAGAIADDLMKQLLKFPPQFGVAR